ncbi:translation initiation factor SUI1 [Xylariales sp. PMI_506]|nr:translation initiation factor SUI1 [Xylariales sp. PMI_506]
MADTETAEAPGEPQGRHVIYCGVCTLPPEYCEYGGTVKKCQDWLQAASKIANSVVTIKRVERNKRKYVTAVSGLEAFGLDLKKMAKEFGKKFATGSSVTKVPSGGEEIVVQGDVSDEIEEFLLEKYKDIPEDNIELVDDKAKKKSAGAS